MEGRRVHTNGTEWAEISNERDAEKGHELHREKSEKKIEKGKKHGTKLKKTG
jgi:hypothetical protein